MWLAFLIWTLVLAKSVGRIACFLAAPHSSMLLPRITLGSPLPLWSPLIAGPPPPSFAYTGTAPLNVPPLYEEIYNPPYLDDLASREPLFINSKTLPYFQPKKPMPLQENQDQENAATFLRPRHYPYMKYDPYGPYGPTTGRSYVPHPYKNSNDNYKSSSNVGQPHSYGNPSYIPYRRYRPRFGPSRDKLALYPKSSYFTTRHNPPPSPSDSFQDFPKTSSGFTPLMGSSRNKTTVTSYHDLFRNPTHHSNNVSRTYPPIHKLTSSASNFSGEILNNALPDFNKTMASTLYKQYYNLFVSDSPNHVHDKMTSASDRYDHRHANRHHSPSSSNSVEYTYNLKIAPECAKDTDNTFCFDDPNYPEDEMRHMMTRDPQFLDHLLADPDFLPADDLLESGNATSLEDGEGLCKSRVFYGQPLRARNIDGHWKIVLNFRKPGEYAQHIRLEKCSSTGSTCSFSGDTRGSSCVQNYNYHRLLSYSPDKGIHVDVFKLPIGCSCFQKRQS